MRRSFIVSGFGLFNEVPVGWHRLPFTGKEHTLDGLRSVSEPHAFKACWYRRETRQCIGGGNEVSPK